jgi:hypothetical protein
MNASRVIEVFNRDMNAAIVTGNPEYVDAIIRHAIEFYSYERGLPLGHQAKIFRDAEYQFLIELYEAEYSNRRKYRKMV